MCSFNTDLDKMRLIALAVLQFLDSNDLSMLNGKYAFLCVHSVKTSRSIQHLGFFLAEEGPAGPVFRLKSRMGNNPRMSAGAEEDLDLSFLDWKLPESYLFFERTRQIGRAH